MGKSNGWCGACAEHGDPLSRGALPRELSHNTTTTPVTWWRGVESTGRIIRLWRREEKTSVGTLGALVKCKCGCSSRRFLKCLSSSSPSLDFNSLRKRGKLLFLNFSSFFEAYAKRNPYRGGSIPVLSTSNGSVFSLSLLSRACCDSTRGDGLN